MTITEGNKLIAEFMGYKYVGEPTPNSHNNGWWKNGKVTSLKLHNHFLCRNHKQLAYHSSWDWLIPACRKWDTIYEGKKWSEKKYKKYEKLCEALDHYASLYEITPLYVQLIKCIQWYNKNQQP